MFTGAELCNKLPPGRESQRAGWVRTSEPCGGQVDPQGTLQAVPATHSQYRS